MADAASSSTSLQFEKCWFFDRCCQHAKHYFECSISGCRGPDPQGLPTESSRIALCARCARGSCPFCSASVQHEDLRSLTDQPATATLTSDPELWQGAVHRRSEHQTLGQFNKNFEELADEVQRQMRALAKTLAMSASERPEIANLLEDAEALFRGLAGKGLQPDRDTYRWLISLYARAERREQVEQWAYKMEESGNCSTEAYNSVMFGFAVPHGVDRADMWFNRMLQNDCVPDVKSYTILIQACARSRDSARAHLYFERMQVAKLKPNDWTFGHLIRACANEKFNPRSLQKAEAFWRDMRQADVKPSEFTCRAMLQACANAGNICRASYIFSESVKAGFVPDVVTFTTMISVFIMKGDVQGAEEWFSKMQAAEVSPNVATFSCVIRVCGTAGDERNAYKWLAKLEAAGFKPSKHTYEALMICGINRKDFGQADVWLQRMLDSGVTWTIKTFHILLQACERFGNLSQAEKWFNAMMEAGVQPDVEAFNSLLRTSATYDSSRWRRMTWQSDQKKKWFLKMCKSGVQPNEATHDILTCSFSVGRAVVFIGCLALASLSLVLLQNKNGRAMGYLSPQRASEREREGASRGSRRGKVVHLWRRVPTDWAMQDQGLPRQLLWSFWIQRARWGGDFPRLQMAVTQNGPLQVVYPD